jgi:hypothetical protein
MPESNPTVRILNQEITLDCVDLAGSARQLDAELSYDALDPYAVTMTFRTRQGDIPWVFCRELMLEGTADPSGDGDVHIWPSIDTQGRAIVVIELHSNSGSFVAHARTNDVNQFLNKTQSIVPMGAEAVDVDAMIESLLTSA